jgi:hypothetical protein
MVKINIGDKFYSRVSSRSFTVIEEIDEGFNIRYNDDGYETSLWYIPETVFEGKYIKYETEREELFLRLKYSNEDIVK